MPRCITRAFLESLGSVMASGEVPSRNGPTRELRSHVIRVDRPLERVIVVPERHNSIFHAVAETLWVLAGRNDVGFLEPYLPRAAEFSDDGKVWRAAYGPRLRKWPSDDAGRLADVDQVAKVVEILSADPGSRRAVISLFDPARDFVESKDIPCNNWLHFLIRDGKLNLTVAIRSNDAVWGWSGINAFEWSVLQELVAHWVGVDVGDVTYMVGSWHVYERHYKRADKILARAPRKTLYESGIPARPILLPASVAQMGADLEVAFAVEAHAREGQWDEAGVGAEVVRDPFLHTSVELLTLYHLCRGECDSDAVERALERLPVCDLRVAAAEYLVRNGYPDCVRVLSTHEREFLATLRAPARGVTVQDVYDVLRVLHEKKSRAYGDSWKKHGELLGVFSNITRKYDRIESILGGAKATADEALVDTYADLAVYAAKYLTFLAEHYQFAFADFIAEYVRVTNLTSAEVSKGYCGNRGFDAVVDALLQGDNIGRLHSFIGMEYRIFGIDAVRAAYKILEVDLVSSGARGNPTNRCRVAAILSLAAVRCVVDIAEERPAAFAAFAAAVEAM